MAKSSKSKSGGRKPSPPKPAGKGVDYVLQLEVLGDEAKTVQLPIKLPEGVDPKDITIKLPGGEFKVQDVVYDVESGDVILDVGEYNAVGMNQEEMMKEHLKGWKETKKE